MKEEIPLFLSPPFPPQSVSLEWVSRNCDPCAGMGSGAIESSWLVQNTIYVCVSRTWHKDQYLWPSFSNLDWSKEMKSRKALFESRETEQLAYERQTHTMLIKVPSLFLHRDMVHAHIVSPLEQRAVIRFCFLLGKFWGEQPVLVLTFHDLAICPIICLSLVQYLASIALQTIQVDCHS